MAEVERLRNPKNIMVGNKTLKKILKLHTEWVSSGLRKGKQADLQGADLWMADLRGINLRGADLHGADLQGADLRKVNLQGADLHEADIRKADLRGADLRGTNLWRVNLQGADLQKADLWRSNLWGADLWGADLRGANLIDADLGYTDLRMANITGARITSIANFNWKIIGIICDYIFTDKKGKERLPRKKDFEKGEFYRLYRSTPTIEYIFKQGMNWFDIPLMDYVSLDVGMRNPKFGLDFVAIDRRGFYPRATFEVASDEVARAALSEVTKNFETLKKQLTTTDKQVEFLKKQKKFLDSHPRQLIMGKSSESDGPQIQLRINIKQVNIVLIRIKRIVEKAPEEHLGGQKKEQVLDIIKSALGGLWATSDIEGVKEVIELSEYFNPELMVELAPDIEELKTLIDL